MSGMEKRLVKWLVEKKDLLFFLVVNIAFSVVVRYAARNFLSGDMSLFLVPWYEQMKQNGGLSSLSKQVGNYNLLYQTIIAVLTYCKLDSIYLYKIVSIVFDYLLAYGCAAFVCQVKKERRFGLLFNMVFAIVIFLPTVVLNGAYWGQCDSIYTFFVVLTLFCLYREKYLAGFLCFGVAFAFKLQAIFILPFLICYYFYKKKFSVGLFFVSLLVFWSSGIAAFCMGRSLFSPFLIYFSQVGIYQEMWLNTTSFWMLVGNSYEDLKFYALFLTLVLCGSGLYLILAGKKKLDTPERFFNTAIWFVWTCVLFLPAMHERYTYLLDILLLLICFFKKKYMKYAAVSVLLSLITYGNHLFSNGGVTQWHVLLYLAMWGHFSYSILEGERVKQ